MHLSVLTSRGQTTIPKEIREALDLKPQDTIIYVPDGNKVFITSVRGNILDTKGAFKKKSKGTTNFKKLREKTKKKIAENALKEME